MLKVVEHTTETVDMPILNAACTTESTGSESKMAETSGVGRVERFAAQMDRTTPTQPIPAITPLESEFGCGNEEFALLKQYVNQLEERLHDVLRHEPKCEGNPGINKQPGNPCFGSSKLLTVLHARNQELRMISDQVADILRRLEV